MNIKLEIRRVLQEVFREEYGYDDEYEDDVAYAEDEGEQYFNPTLPEDIKKFSNKYEGRGVDWYGDPYQMIVIHKDDIYGMWGNIYDPKKLKFMANLIREYPENVEIECSYGSGGIIDITDIVEEQNAKMQNRFSTDYEGKDRPASTGNEVLDRYAGIEDFEELGEFGDIWWGIQDEVKAFFEENRHNLVYERKTAEQLKQEFATLNPEDDEIGLYEEFMRLEMGLKHASDSEQGDFNKFTVQLRDGHHRVMGAIEAGEEYVCLNLEKEQIKEFQGYYTKVN